MCGKRYCNEAQAATISSRPQKKVHHEPRNTRSHDSYTVAWICALSIEMSAARAMLDEVHEGLAQDAKDINCYELGCIGKHNVAIACLPNGKYGTNNAATVFTNMTRTFKNIQLGLVVGIGGGAPSKIDLRLGDVVVASEVIQHDMGKAMGDGLFQRTPIHWRVHNSIGTVVSSLRSKHACGSNRVPSILREKSEKFETFKRPVTADRLFVATYQHESSTPDCVGCDQSKLIQRELRDSNDPVIHYGAIASGNQVIKDSVTRDKLTEDLKVLCFEMEAAGLMEICPCLPVRGICDYSDSHKTKEWQRFAALTAAAYAREFLDELPVCKDLSRQPSGPERVRLEEKDNECLRDLRITNPQDDKETIIKAKGRLLPESYIWVMENESYQQWINDDESRLLWIKGDPGKGKTMLLCGIINEIESSSPHSVFYFFCQAAEPRLRSASAVLRGLIWFLARTRPNLITHIRKQYDQAGKGVFNDHNALQALSSIMAAMLEDEATSDCVFVIDALDECVDDRERLIELVSQFSSSSRSKWIVSSRNWPEIEAQLEGVTNNVRLHLELNHASIADAVEKFIARKVEDLTKRKRYTESTRDAVLHHLLTNANDTFLWVSLVCEELGKYNALPHHTQSILESFPPGLDDLYQRMINQIRGSRDEEFCKAVLAVVTVAFEPLSLAELAASDERFICFHSDLETLSSIINSCGSFLAVRNNIVYTVHQSVKDYLLKSFDIFPSGITGQHYSIFQSIMDRMQEALHRNLYGLHDDALYMHEISKPPSSSLDATRYGCIYWVDHLHKSALQATEGASACILVEKFLNTKYLYWLEAMSLLRCAPTAVRALRKLVSVLPETASKELKDFAQDALRFALSHRVICDTVPLQLYDSALIFSPERSQVRQAFIGEISANIRIFPSSFQRWDALLFNIPSIAKEASDLRASPGGKWLAVTNSHGRDGTTILLLDSFTGEIVRKIKSPQSVLSILGFDAEGKHLATVNYHYFGYNVMIWNTYTGEPIQTFEIRSDAVVLSHDRMSLIMVESSGHVQVLDPWDGSSKYTLDLQYREGRMEWIDLGIAKSGAPCLLSIRSTRHLTGHIHKVFVHNPRTGDLITSAPLATGRLDYHAALDPDGKRLLIALSRGGLWLWDGEMLEDLHHAFGGHSFPTCSAMAWAPDDQGSLKMLDVGLISSESTVVYNQPFNPVHHLNTGPNGQLELCRDLRDNEILTVATDNTLHQLHISGSADAERFGVFSPYHHYAFVDRRGLINVWDTSSCLCLHKLRGHAHDTELSDIVVKFDQSGQLVSANHEDDRIRIWNPLTGDCLRTFDLHHWSYGLCMAASTDGRIAITHNEQNVLYTWASEHVGGGRTKWTVSGRPLRLSFNSRGLLALLWQPTAGKPCITILDVNLGTCLRTYCPLWHSTPYCRFDPGINLRIDVGYGVLDLDLENLTEAEEGLEEEEFRVSGRYKQPVVWNEHFLALRRTATQAWLMRGSKKILWIPRSAADSVRLIPNFDTGASMAAMIYNSHAVIIHIGPG
ncbi:hypothetical protein FGADI_12207 [Fusarium gaditjirri]|uniref:NACHT domain-containing protein n=1 Tax=Fusarium gaditjirri TaxID=282569 RepID=A0A8H4SSP0_9HYPO|nr:hypothetical protein FGADI_12207 [Fusarium gaditjirri]